jgi:Uma2 family endonuclease
VIEVISPGSAAHDHIRKLALYEHHGVREYWIVHPIDHILSIYQWQDGEYGKPAEYELTGTTKASTLPVSIAWERVLANIGG